MPSISKHFIKYLLFSFLGYGLLGMIFYFVTMFIGLAGLGNASKSFFDQLGVILIIIFVLLLIFFIFLLTRKSLQRTEKLIVAIVPLLLWVGIVMNLNRIFEKSHSLVNNIKLNNTIKQINFEGTFRVTKVKPNNNPYSNTYVINIPFTINKELGLNRVIYAYDVEIDVMPLDIYRKGNSECPLNNLVFNAVIDNKGNKHKVSVYYGDGEILPPGKYVAVKKLNFNVSSPEDNDLCNRKFLTSNKVNIYKAFYPNNRKNEFLISLRRMN